MTRDFSTRILRLIKSEITSFIAESDDHVGDDPDKHRVQVLVGRLREELGKAIAEHHTIKKRSDIVAAELANLADKAEFAIGRDRDDLAKAVLEKKHTLQDELSTLTHDLERIEDVRTQLEEAIDFLTQGSSSSDSPPQQSVSAKLAELDRLINQPATTDKTS